jgi:hypothetical protein
VENIYRIFWVLTFGKQDEIEKLKALLQPLAPNVRSWKRDSQGNLYDGRYEIETGWDLPIGDFQCFGTAHSYVFFIFLKTSKSPSSLDFKAFGNRNCSTDDIPLALNYLITSLFVSENIRILFSCKFWLHIHSATFCGL